MNPPIRKLSVVIVIMFLTLMIAATYIQFFRAPSLNADERNVRTLYREYGTDRGAIIVGETPIATSEPVKDPYNYLRKYAHGPLYAHVTGYFSTVFNSMTGIERAENSVLGGSDESLVTERIEDLFTGSQPKGGAVALTIDPKVQNAAFAALGNRRGAVLALEPVSGRILALVSTPSYDPNLLAGRDAAAAKTAWEKYSQDAAKPLLNRAIGGDIYAPGSVFKLITASAMLESGITPDTVVEAPTFYSPPGTDHKIYNPGQDACGDGSGKVALRYAFKWSCNTPFAIAGVNLGADAMIEQAEAFGFNSDLTIPLQVRGSRFPVPQDDAALAMDSFGQRDIQVSPLQMAMVGAAIANDGVLMTPYLVDARLTADLEPISTTTAKEFSRPISRSTAQALRSMMIDVVNSGSGRPAQSGYVQIAGKTGSAELSEGTKPHSWFVGFDAVENPSIVVAVFVENGGYGADVAAPIAKKVIEAKVTQ